MEYWDLDGNEVIDEMRAIRRDISIVVSSGYSMTDISKTYGYNEIGMYLQKPYQMNSLIRVIRDAMRKKHTG